MYSRPKPLETEEDLLRMQRQFEQDKQDNRIKPAATVVSACDQPPEPSPSTSQPIDTIQDRIANTFEAIPEPSGLGQIVERINLNATTNPQTRPIWLNKEGTGFPVPKKRDLDVIASEGQSIFAKQFKKMKPVNKPVVGADLPQSSAVLMGDDRHEIHLENIHKIKSMTEEEIVEERERLLSTMDPAIVAFLKSRREKLNQHEKTVQSIQKQNESATNLKIEDIETPNEILKQPEAEKWFNFDDIETNKLAWMKDVDVPKIYKKDSFEARFDFEGFLLPYTANEISEKNRILYHHGEEPGRPGYTLQELIQLSRSNLSQQKIIALNTISNILSLQSTGLYDNIIELPIEQLFFVLRFCLDDNTPSILNSAVKAMRNLICNQVDETCLDALLGFGFGTIQPVLAEDGATEDDNTVNDQQLAESNLIRCLLRSEILTRIKYIINTVHPQVETIVYCIDILIRLSRDSQFVMSKVYKCPELMANIIDKFVPSVLSAESTSQCTMPLYQAVKLLRILSSRSQTIARDFCTKYKIMNSILHYLSSQNYSLNTNGLKLQTESLNLFAVFLRYNLALEDFDAATPVLIGLLNYHFANTDLVMTSTFIRQSHIASLLLLLGESAKRCNVTPFLEIVNVFAVKWMRQCMALSSFQCGKLQLISALFQLLPGFKHYEQSQVISLTANLISSPGFNVITQTLMNGSMLLNNYETHKSSANLKTLESACWNASEHVIPLIQSNSAIPFLSALASLIVAVDDQQVKQMLLKHENVQKYLECLRCSKQFHLSGNWFTRVESQLILNILKMSVLVKNNIDTRPFYEIAVKALGIFNAEQKPSIEFILNEIILCKNFYPSEVLLRNLNIVEQTDSLRVSLNNLNEISAVYSQVLGLKKNVPNFSTNQCLDISSANAVPIDWIYTPIIVLYSQQQENKTNMLEQEQVFITRNCLRWILIYETYFPELASLINPTDRFCRLACIFLGSDNLFLIEEIHDLLAACFRNIATRHERQIDFNKEIQGLTSFQDLYTQLLEQYQGVSYGNILFGNFILLPLAQRHSIKFRKALWSEYMGVVETFNVTRDQILCSADNFLQPVEQDVSLLKCYRRAIVTGTVRKHTILYEIAKHHVDQHVLALRNKKITC